MELLDFDWVYTPVQPFAHLVMRYWQAAAIIALVSFFFGMMALRFWLFFIFLILIIGASVVVLRYLGAADNEVFVIVPIVFGASFFVGVGYAALRGLFVA